MGILDTRGWVLQEQLLSPRVLSFTDHGMYWECTQWICSENQPTGVEGSSVEKQDFRDMHIQMFRRYALDVYLRNDSRELGYWLWRQIVGHFTTRSLSKERDRIAAVSGIGQMFAPRLVDELVAGLWKKRLLGHLLWWVPIEGRYEPDKWHGRPKEFSAPTWSWASVLGPVSYKNMSGDEGSRFQSGDLHPAAKVLSVETHIDLSTGSVTGSVEIEGMLYKMYQRHPQNGRLWVGPGSGEAQDMLRYSPPPESSDDKWERWHPDTFPVPEGEIYCLYVGSGGIDLQFQYTLCLVPVESSKSLKEPCKIFRRVGVCAWNPRHIELRTGKVLGLHRDSGRGTLKAGSACNPTKVVII
jgi:hypothetical protein